MPELKHLVEGMDLADSLTLDGEHARRLFAPPLSDSWIDWTGVPLSCPPDAGTRPTPSCIPAPDRSCSLSTPPRRRPSPPVPRPSPLAARRSPLLTPELDSFNDIHIKLI